MPSSLNPMRELENWRDACEISLGWEIIAVVLALPFGSLISPYSFCRMDTHFLLLLSKFKPLSRSGSL